MMSPRQIDELHAFAKSRCERDTQRDQLAKVHSAQLKHDLNALVRDIVVLLACEKAGNDVARHSLRDARTNLAAICKVLDAGNRE